MFRICIALVLILTSCSNGRPGIPNELRYDPVFYFNDSEVATLQVYYETGAEPFSGDLGGTNPILEKVWDLTFLNLEEIFSFKSTNTAINVPRELNEMTSMGEIDQETWDINAIVKLAEDQKIKSKQDQEAIFSVFFVGGFFDDQGEVRTNVVGVNISGTSITIIFKDVINSMPQSLRVFSEQATVIHEVGHALGFVNNGVPAVADHFDGINGAHSNLEDCIMYHLNEGASDLIQFIIDFNASGDATLWGPGVLEDVEAFSN